MEKVNISEKFSQIQKHWEPKITGSLNGQHVKLVKVKGAFMWHHHEEADELFLVIHGQLKMHLRDEVLVLNPGEYCIVPRGVEHMPEAEEETHILLFEPAGTLNTGNVRNENTVDAPDWV